MEKVRPCCSQPSDRKRLQNRTSIGCRLVGSECRDKTTSRRTCRRCSAAAWDSDTSSSCWSCTAAAAAGRWRWTSAADGSRICLACSGCLEPTPAPAPCCRVRTGDPGRRVWHSTGSPAHPSQGRPHIAANGVSWPPGKMDEKFNSENVQKREQSGQADVENGAMLIT